MNFWTIENYMEHTIFVALLFALFPLQVAESDVGEKMQPLSFLQSHLLFPQFFIVPLT